jgi:hypothetical protein
MNPMALVSMTIVCILSSQNNLVYLIFFSKDGFFCWFSHRCNIFLEPNSKLIKHNCNSCSMIFIFKWVTNAILYSIMPLKFMFDNFSFKKKPWTLDLMKKLVVANHLNKTKCLLTIFSFVFHPFTWL